MLPTRITYLSRLYHHRDGVRDPSGQVEGPTDHSASYERDIPGRHRPCVLDLDLGADWAVLPVQNCALFQLSNPRPVRQVRPTPEEQAEEDARVVLVAAGTPPVPFARVRPGEFLPPVEPVPGQHYFANCDKGTAVTLTTFPT